jgi:ribosomal protein L10
MKIALKESKVKKLKKILNTNIFFIICNNSSITSDKFLKLTQELIKLNLYCYKINNKLLKRVYKDSIFKNYVNSINGSFVLILVKQGCITSNYNVISAELRKYKIEILGVYFNYKLYSINQLKKLSYLNYERNMELFHASLKTLLTMPCSTFIK